MKAVFKNGTWKKQVCNTGSESKGSAYEPFECNQPIRIHRIFLTRLDGNNVDVDTEQVELASEQLRYTALTDSITHEISRFKSVLG